MLKLPMCALCLIPLFAMASPSSGQNEIYTKPMASFAAYLGFEPLQGNVKLSYQQIKDEQGKLRVFAAVEFDKSGCLAKATYYRKIADIIALLEREGRTFYAYRNKKKFKVFQVNEQCMITEEFEKERKFIYNEGLLSKVIERNGEESEYFFNDRNELLKIVNYSDRGGTPLSSQQFDYTRKEMKLERLQQASKVDGEQAVEVTICDGFDSKNNPIHCNAVQNIKGIDTKLEYFFKTEYYD